LRTKQVQKQYNALKSLLDVITADKDDLISKKMHAEVH
jgi:hypothetical protein